MILYYRILLRISPPPPFFSSRHDLDWGGGLLPRAYEQGVKQSVCMSVVCCCRRRHENRQISRSRHLCVLFAQPISRYRWKTGLYALRIAQKGLLVLQIVHFCSVCLWFIDHTHSFSMLMWLRMLKLNVGTGRQIIKLLHSVQYYAVYSGMQSAWGMCSTEL